MWLYCVVECFLSWTCDCNLFRFCVYLAWKGWMPVQVLIGYLGAAERLCIQPSRGADAIHRGSINTPTLKHRSQEWVPLPLQLSMVQSNRALLLPPHHPLCPAQRSHIAGTPSQRPAVCQCYVCWHVFLLSQFVNLNNCYLLKIYNHSSRCHLVIVTCVSPKTSEWCWPSLNVFLFICVSFWSFCFYWYLFLST